MVVTATPEQIMQYVLELAARGSQTTHPNPRVGCVLINNGEIVGEGFHHSAGGLHAEREALKQAGERARGAIAYINLEPCCHQGRTPPCTDGLIDAGVAKVVAAMRDPNPQVAGGGFENLKLAGIEISAGLLEDQARWLNRGFVQRMRKQIPWVTIKSAATLDGRTAAFDGQSKWITGSQARAQVQELRAASAAVITGIGTVLADDPELNVRLDTAERQPLRVVLDSQLRLPTDAKIIADGEDFLVFTCSQDSTKIAELTELGVEVIQQQGTDTGRLDLREVLLELGRWQCNEVLVEAGQALSGAFLAQGLVDELVLFYAGSVLGDQGRAMYEYPLPTQFTERQQFKITATQMVGDDVRIDAVNPVSLAALGGG